MNDTGPPFTKTLAAVLMIKADARLFFPLTLASPRMRGEGIEEGGDKPSPYGYGVFNGGMSRPVASRLCSQGTR